MPTQRCEQQPKCSITLIPFSNFPAREAFEGNFDRFESKKLHLSCRQPLPSSQAITVEHEDMLFLGEVIACTPKSEGEWTVLIKVEQILTALQSLLRLRKELLDAEKPIRSTPLREAAVAA